MVTTNNPGVDKYVHGVGAPGGMLDSDAGPLRAEATETYRRLSKQSTDARATLDEQKKAKAESEKKAAD